MGRDIYREREEDGHIKNLKTHTESIEIALSETLPKFHKVAH